MTSTDSDTKISRRPRRVSFEQLRARIGEPEERIKAKVSDRIESYARRFLAHSPFLALATSDASGLPDCSPRGDYPGFAKVLDERTLAIPDRPGNKLADSFANLAGNDGVGLLFLIPGMREVLRINGRGYPTDEPDVLARMRTEAKEPMFALVVEVSEVFLHCGRALVRSRLWDPASRALAAEMPTAGEVAAEQMGLQIDPAVLDQQLEAAYRQLY